MMREPDSKGRRGRPRPSDLAQPDVPYTMRMADGRTVYVEVPGRFSAKTRAGEVALTPEGVRFLDRIRALMMDVPGAPSPGYIAALREALGLSQQEFAERIGVNKLTVSRWERGALRPGAASLDALRKLRRQAVRRGVSLPG